VITSDLPQLDALGPSVVRVPRGDVTALAAAIQSLEDDAAWSSRVSSARALVERRFSAAAAGRAYAELYSEIL
jgi:glycosyltransferase involved in cell wall biosynthesis